MIIQIDIKKILLNILLICFLTPVVAQQIPTQVPTEAEARSELAKRGIDEAVMEAALRAEGIDPENMQNLTPAQVQKVIEITKRLEAEASTAAVDEEKSTTTLDTIPEDIIDNIPRDLTDLKLDSLLELNQDSILLDSIRQKMIYGHDIFKTGDVRIFKQSSEINAPGSYILASGDEITISIFGNSQLEEKHEVRADGYIRILNGRVRLLMRGSSLDQVKQKILRAYSDYYRFKPSEFEVTLNQSRTVSINILGDVENPGTVTMSALNSAFNALVSIKGPTEIGSVRKIKLIKNKGGDVKELDVYKYLTDPRFVDDFFLEDNDIIHVPVQGKVVTIIGEVKRPMRYELLDKEGLKALLKYSGGLTDRAYKKTFRVKRYEDDVKKVSDIPYLDLVRSNGDFELLDGDEIMVDVVKEDPRNFVSVIGEVINEGEFEKSGGMKLYDLLLLARLKPESRTDKAYLIRTNPDGTYSYEILNIDEVLRDKNSSENLILEDRDELVIWSKDRFADAMFVTVEGAIREEGQIPFDRAQNLRVLDLLEFGGGLRRDADNIAILHRSDPLIPNEMQYITVRIDEILKDGASEQNVTLEPFDKLYIVSKNVFEEETFIRVGGAVNQSGTFVYGKGMTIEDALTLANGFQLAAATNNIEVSRIIIKDNEPTTTIIANLSVDRNFNVIDGEDSKFVLQPFDNLFVRYVPEFELQQNVTVQGEIVYPGPYSIIDDNESITSILKRAGGLTKEAFTAGATLYRSQDSLGYIVMRLDEVIKDPKSIYNYILKNGDVITIPKQKDFVTIKGATRAKEVLADKIVGRDSTVRVAYHPGKNASWYIDYYAGGISEKGKKNRIFVEHPNGEIKQTERFLFWRKYPEVRKGSVIKVGVEPPKTIEEGQKEEVNWTKILGDSVAQVTSILTLILLVQRLD